MANLKADVALTIKWLAAAVKKLKSILDEHSMDKLARATMLIDDIRHIQAMYLQAVASILPENAITPMPKNWLNKVKWVGANMDIINALVQATSGVNPFENAKIEAKAIAYKWGFGAEVYEVN